MTRGLVGFVCILAAMGCGETSGAGGSAGTAGTGGGTGGEGGLGGEGGQAGSSAIGILDASFGTDGIVVHDGAASTNGDDEGHAIATDANGKILVAGSAVNSRGDADMVIWRYNEDGTLDPAFGTGGIVVHDGAAGGTADDRGQAIALNPSGKILVTGSSFNARGDADMVIWRYNEDGMLDPGFGMGGIVVHDGAAGGDWHDEGQAITLNASGKILITGNSWSSDGNVDMVIWQYDEDGTLDPSFGTNGIVVDAGAAGGAGFSAQDLGSAIVIDGAGRILVTGSSGNADRNLDMVIWRYNPDGTLDPSFGSGGIVVHGGAAGGTGTDQGRSITVDTEKRILVAGVSQGESPDMTIWRYDQDGTLDAAFGTDGIVVHDGAAGGTGFDGAFEIRDTAGKILVAGASVNARGDTDMAIWRYDQDGTLDPGFGTGGIVVHHNAAGGQGDDSGLAMTLDTSRRILVTGLSASKLLNWDLAIWRYE